MEPNDILLKYYSSTSKAYQILVEHSQAVAEFATEIAQNSGLVNLDTQFIWEAAMLHDIGVFKCDAPSIGCYGTENYMRHGVIGREILEAEGLPKHALVCERHVGVGLTREDIIEQKLPIPERDMMPVTDEETIIAFADLFFSKTKAKHVRTAKEVEEKISRYGEDKVQIFHEWKERYRFKE